jgi:outer membrane receptor for ferrienterochelin and colicins
VNFNKKFYFKNGSFMSLDASAWYTHFNNQIIPDYLTNPDQIIYSNLNGYAVSKGISANLDMDLDNGIKILAGISLLDVFSKQNNKFVRPLLTEKWTGTWGISYKLNRTNLNMDYTGNIYGPMRLPLLGDSDPRSEYSPVWSLQNIQLTYGGFQKLEIYAGMKNLLNWKPGRNEPFLIANSRDPFDKNVKRDASGTVISSSENPYALSFDPGYVYAPNQGIRAFLGFRYTLR